MMEWSKKKFWKSFYITFSPEQGGHVIFLDDKIYRSKKGNIVKIPSVFLAKRVENEWKKSSEEFVRSNLPITQIIEQISDMDDESYDQKLKEVLEYAKTDLLCYRVTSPKKLKNIQEKNWDPILNIYDSEFDIKMLSTVTLEYVNQDKESLDRFLEILKTYQAPKLFLIYKMTQLLGSALLSVLIEQNFIDEKKAWMLSRIEEDWQHKIWGKDEENLEVEKNKRNAFELLNACLKNFEPS